jgi:hypothetical protein
MLNIYLLLNTDKLSESNYNSLLQSLITQSLTDTKRKSSINLTNIDEHKNKLINSISEEKAHEISMIPERYKKDIIYPKKIKDECDKSISKFEYLQDNSMTKDWDNIINN